MIYEIASAIKTMIAGEFNDVEFYEGQFENFDEQIVNPPWAYLDVSRGLAGEVGVAVAELEFKLYLISSRIVRDPDSMLELLEKTIAALHHKAVRSLVNNVAAYMGKCFCGEYKPLVVYPGLSVWELTLKVMRAGVDRQGN